VNGRCSQTEYHVDSETEDQLKDKRVRCLSDSCSFTSPLRVFLLHSHGRTNYSNADVDFDRIQSEQHRFFPLPSLAALEVDSEAAGAMDIREQLLQVSVCCSTTALAVHIHIHTAPATQLSCFSLKL